MIDETGLPGGLPDAERKPLPTEEKAALMAQGLAAIEGYKTVAVGESLSLELAMHQDVLGECDWSKVDVGPIPNLFLEYYGIDPVRDHVLKIEAQALEASGLDVKYRPFYYSGVYSDFLRPLALKQRSVRFDNDALSPTIDVMCMTPALLLVAMGGRLEDGTPEAEDFEAKIKMIKSANDFSHNAFTMLADLEIAEKDRMNEGTFNIWKQNLLEVRQGSTNVEDFLEDRDAPESMFKRIGAAFDILESLVDKDKLIERFKETKNLANIDFYSVRRTPNLEKFLIKERNARLDAGEADEAKGGDDSMA